MWIRKLGPRLEFPRLKLMDAEVQPFVLVMSTSLFGPHSNTQDTTCAEFIHQTVQPSCMSWCLHVCFFPGAWKSIWLLYGYHVFGDMITFIDPTWAQQRSRRLCHFTLISQPIRQNAPWGDIFVEKQGCRRLLAQSVQPSSGVSEWNSPQNFILIKVDI